MKSFNYLLLLFASVCIHSNVANAQGDQIFDQSIVHEVYLEFDEATFWTTLTSNYDNNYPNVPYIMANATIDGINVDSIGVRLKGFSSYWVATNKKSIKLDFNEFVSGKKYDGLKKVNLNNGEGDPAVQRDQICYDIMRNADVKAARTAYAKVFLNDEYWGLYLLVEQIDKTFIKQNFSNEGGNLFKNMANSELDWLGSDTLAYQDIFELKSGDQAGAWARFVELMNVINNASDATFKDAISEVFDVDLYLKVLAVDIATNNWDSYIEHGRNFYLYEDPVSLKFKWIPWDYNLAIGGQFSSIGGGGGGYSTDTIANPELCQTIINGSCPYPPEDSIFVQVINQDDFCCNSDWDEVCQGIYDDIANGNNGGGGSNPGGGFSSSFPINMSSSQKVLINRLLAVPEFETKYYQYWCDLLEDNLTTERLFPMIEQSGDLIRDDIYADPNYMWNTQAFEADLDQGNNFIPGLKKFFSERPTALRSELDNLFDCDALVSSLVTGDIMINEFMAANDSLSGLADPAGEYDDWIELFNNTSEPIDLSNAYLSDDADAPQKWAFPSGTTIDAGAYLIVWADKDDGQEGLHADFKLAKDGDFIMLSDYDLVLDSISYTTQVSNLTASRIPNGTGDFIIQAPTFNDNNENVTSTSELDKINQQVRIYPNPTNDMIHIVFEEIPQGEVTFSLHTSLGQQVLSKIAQERRTTLAANHLPPGIYVLTATTKQEGLIVNRKIVVY